MSLSERQLCHNFQHPPCILPSQQIAMLSLFILLLCSISAASISRRPKTYALQMLRAARPREDLKINHSVALALPPCLSIVERFFTSSGPLIIDASSNLLASLFISLAQRMRYSQVRSLHLEGSAKGVEIREVFHEQGLIANLTYESS